jgi:hypothetical protein
VRSWRKQKELLKGANSAWKAFRGPKHGNFNAVAKKALEFVLENVKMAFPLPEKQYKWRHWKLLHPWRFHSKISKPVMVGQ